MVESAVIEPTFTGSGPVSLPLTELSISSVFYPGSDFLENIIIYINDYE